MVDTGKPEADIEKTKWLRDELAVDAAENGIKVFAIAFTEHADFFLIQSLAKKSGGEYFRAMAPSDLGEVFSAVSEKLNAEPEPEPIPEPQPIVDEPVVVTPLPDDMEPAQELPQEMSPADFLASLSADERLALEGISAETGIPMEQLAQELVGSPVPDGGSGAPEPTTNVPEIVFPDDEPLQDEESSGMVQLLGVAAILLLLVGVVAWFLMRGKNSKQMASSDSTAPAAAAGAAAASSDLLVPEAYINDVNGYTDHQSFRLHEKPMMVGRVAGMDTEHLDYLVVNKGTVGRRHAVVKFKDYSFWIVDQGSVNGTFVNGERISGEHQLKHGDKIRFHKYDFDFSQPDMDDGFHTVFADPNPAEATIVATAATLAATSAMDLAAHIDESRGNAASESLEAAGPAAAFADADIFDLTGATPDSGTETTDSGDTAISETPQSPSVLDSTDENISAAELDEFENAVDPDDDEELGVEINLDTVGAEDHPSLVLDLPPSQDSGDFDAEASAFFEDITVGPTPDDEASPSLEGEGDGMFDSDPEQVSLDEKLEKASAILDSQSDEDDFGEMETVAQGGTPKLDDPNDLTLEEFLETDSFDAPATIPPAMPGSASADEGGDVTLEAFMSTSLFEGGLTNEDATVLPFEVPDEPNAGMDPGETVKLPSAPKFDGQDGGGSEDPTILK
ncbi:MAG: pSer/pThr/pTyr-binding forkhead associated (FHA) protein [Gammaproteobacteria bacterium]